MPRLKDKVALITGGCSGIGAASVALFLQEGARVVIADLQVEAGERMLAEAKDQARFVRCDVTDESSFKAAIELTESEFGKLNILFNNAGAGGTQASICDMSVEEWDKTMALCLRSVMLGIKHAAPLIATGGNGGAIINTASIAGMRPGISSAAYSVAKSGVIQLTRMAAMELAAEKIRVNSIAPGIIPTPAVSAVTGLSPEEVREVLPQIQNIFKDAQPLREAGNPENIAQTALFLASDAAKFVTGQNISVDGGMMLMGPSSLELHRTDGVLQQLLSLGKRSAP